MWGWHEENIAKLVDRLDYWLNSEYSSWNTDPDDPELKAEQARRKKLGIKPPPLPLLQPVAARPQALQDAMYLAYKLARQEAEAPVKKKPTFREVMAMRHS
ncbi:hypothetical protein WG936_05500 [Corynebacterium sp. H127]|uniref:hypothetical protein n=1 Tax=Corynebacterium sp. H127 TaxID=3133418 RepID=UPI0030B1128D